jgi:hypothetical protein
LITHQIALIAVLQNHKVESFSFNDSLLFYNIWMIKSIHNFHFLFDVLL